MMQCVAVCCSVLQCVCVWMCVDERAVFIFMCVCVCVFVCVCACVCVCVCVSQCVCVGDSMACSPPLTIYAGVISEESVLPHLLP